MFYPLDCRFAWKLIYLYSCCGCWYGCYEHLATVTERNTDERFTPPFNHWSAVWSQLAAESDRLSTVHLRAVWSRTASPSTLTLQTEVAARWQRLFSVYECWRSYLCVRRAIHSLTFAVSGALSLCTDLTHAPRLRQQLTPSLAALSTFLHQTGATTPDFQLKAPWESLQRVLRS